MPLNKIETKSTAEVKAGRIASIIKNTAAVSAQSLQRQIGEFTQLMSAIWKPNVGIQTIPVEQQITPAEILAAYGTEAVAAFTASSNAAENLLKQCDLVHEAEVADKLKARILAALALVPAHTKHADGTVTID